MSQHAWSARELERRAYHRLAVLEHAEEVTGSVAATYWYFGISRQVLYRWKRRYEDEGLEGLRDRSSKPHRSPTATEIDVVSKIVYLRQTYHLGPERIAMYLRRNHDVTVSKSGVWWILKRLDMNRLPSSQRYTTHKRRWKRYEKQRASHHVQIEVKFLAPNKGKDGRLRKHYQFTAIDDCTRLRVLRVYPRCDQQTAIAFVDYVAERLPFRIDTIQTDNGAEFQTAFLWHVLDKGFGHTFIKPATPRLNGRVERSHRIDQEELYRLLDGVLNDKLREWEDYYNYDRPHGGLGGRTHCEKLLAVSKT